MKPRFPTLLLACAAVALFQGCEDAPVRVARTTDTLVLSPDKPTPDTEIEVATNLHVVLPGPEMGSGLVWEIVSNNIRVLDQTTALKPDVTAAVDSKPTSSITFYAIKPGKSVLRFVLVPPGEKEATPAAKCAAVIRATD
jgi:hypothetical protein